MDTTVHITDDGRLKTKLHTKPTDRQNYLHRNSAHPNPLLKSIPFGQALRVKRICSDEEEYKTSIKQLKESFLKRGYRNEEINQQLDRANNVERDSLFESKTKTPNNRVMLITKYNRTNPDLKKILDKHWHLLQLDDKLGEVFKEPPMIAYRKNRTISNLLSKKQIEKNGFSRACHPEKKLKCCKLITETNNFSSNITKKTYKIHHTSDCKSKNVIYLLECKLCPVQYVGKAETELHFRLSNYRSEVKKPDPTPSAKHFQLPGHVFEEHARFTIIERIENPPSNKTAKTQLIEQREDRWMSELKTLMPNGINASLNHPQTRTGVL